MGIHHGSCIDGDLINRLFNLDKNFRKDSHQRSSCLCSKSVDMGAYNTCRFFCSYCYANASEKMTYRNLERYSVESPSLISNEMDL
jgi:DNA repair photolyase